MVSVFANRLNRMSIMLRGLITVVGLTFAVAIACVLSCGAAYADLSFATSPTTTFSNMPTTKAEACLLAPATKSRETSAASSLHGAMALEGDSLLVTLSSVAVDEESELLESSVCLLDEQGPVASIGDAEYETLEAAVAAAKEGDTIKLLKDTDENLEAPDFDVTLDLAGHAVYGYLVPSKSAKLTVESSSDPDTDVRQMRWQTDNSTLPSADNLLILSGTSVYNPGSYIDKDASHSRTVTPVGSGYDYYVVEPHAALEEVAGTCSGTYYQCPVCNTAFVDAEGTARTSAANYNHNPSLTAAREATCTEDGNDAYYRCTRCGKLFSDYACKNETTEEGVLRPALGHQKIEVPAAAATCTEDGSTGYWTCSRCGEIYADRAFTEPLSEEEAVIPALGHDWGEWGTTQEATCTAAGSRARTCARCGETETEEVAKLDHVMTKIEFVAATCVGEGHGEYYHCSLCDKYYKDEAGTVETTPEAEETPSIGHQYQNYAAKAATCTTQGNYAYGKCKVCGKYVLINDDGTRTDATESEVFIPTKGHSISALAAKDATCTEAGNIAAYQCSTCGTYFEDAQGTNSLASSVVVIAALGHSLVKTNAVAATTTSTGTKAYYTCSRCGKIFAEDGTTETTLSALTIAKLSSSSSSSSGSSSGTASSSTSSSSKTGTTAASASAASSAATNTASTSSSNTALSSEETDTDDLEIATSDSSTEEGFVLNGFLIGFLIAMGVLAVLIAVAAVVLRRGNVALPSLGHAYAASRSASLAAQQRAEAESALAKRASRPAFSFMPPEVPKSVTATQ